MKFNIPKEWCIRKAKLEQEDIGATLPINPRYFLAYLRQRAASKRADQLCAAPTTTTADGQGGEG